jgi:four helix bundle protein
LTVHDVGAGVYDVSQSGGVERARSYISTARELVWRGRHLSAGRFFAPPQGVAAAHCVEELECWQLGDELKRGIRALVDGPRARDDRRFRNQICDAASSVTRNIAEGFGRKSDPEFVRYLSIARGSLNECQDELKDARAYRYVDPDEYARLLVLSRRTAGAIAALQRYLRQQIRDNKR